MQRRGDSLCNCPVGGPMEAAMTQHQPDRPPSAALRVTHVRAGLSPDPVDSPFAVERLTGLTHDLAGLLDGSLRCLLLARRSLAAAGPRAELQTARRQIETVYQALERMADLVHAAMSGAGGMASVMQRKQPSMTLGDSILHAADVLLPEAEQNGIAIETRISDRAGCLPVGPLYTVVLNAMRNALESIERAQTDPARLNADARSPRNAPVHGGLIEVYADVGPASAAGVIILHIEIRDDGHGVESEESARRAVDVGYTTKRGSLGIGLALAHDVVREVGGSIELRRREDRKDPLRPGAVLRIRYPMVVPEA
jgi:signal transduction histidine kinase